MFLHVNIGFSSTFYCKPVYVCAYFYDGVCVFRRGAVRLGMSKVTQVDFVPKEMVSYSKETQTPTEALLTHTDQKAGKRNVDKNTLYLSSNLFILFFL